MEQVVKSSLRRAAKPASITHGNMVMAPPEPAAAPANGIKNQELTKYVFAFATKHKNAVPPFVKKW